MFPSRKSPELEDIGAELPVGPINTYSSFLVSETEDCHSCFIGLDLGHNEKAFYKL